MVKTNKNMISPEFSKVRNEIQLSLLGYFSNIPDVRIFSYVVEQLRDDDWDYPYSEVFRILKEQLMKKNSLDFIEVIQRVPSVSLSTYTHYGAMVVSAQALKNLVERMKKSTQAMKFLQIANDIHEKSVSGNFDDIEKDITRVVIDIANDKQEGWKSAADVLNEMLDVNKKKSTWYLQSKYQALNDLIYAYQSGDLHIIAARPGVGKTTFLLNEAVHIAMQGEKVGFLTLEMPAEQCMRRVVSMISRTPLRELYNRDLLSQEIVEHKIHELPLYLYEDYSCYWVDVLMKIRKIYEHGARVIFIDQLSHIRHDQRAYSKADAIEKTVRAIRSLALELNIVVIMAVQINRQASQAETPDLEHLKDSGSIEEASQLVLMLQRKDGALKAYIRKATHGRLGEFTLSFQADVCRVEESGQAMTW